MSDEIRPISPISRIEPISPVASLRQMDSHFYQIFAAQLVHFFENNPAPPPPSVFFTPIFPWAPPEPLRRLDRKRFSRKKEGSRKIAAVFQALRALYRRESSSGETSS